MQKWRAMRCSKRRKSIGNIDTITSTPGHKFQGVD